ncbi:MAG: alpha-amylase family glycosyl hydrolase [Chitinophagaceae bacterium]
MKFLLRGLKGSDGGSIGDFRGLSQKLDYLQDLGITTIWLVPILLLIAIIDMM